MQSEELLIALKLYKTPALAKGLMKRQGKKMIQPRPSSVRKGGI